MSQVATVSSSMTLGSLLALIEGDALKDAAPVLMGFLQDIINAKGDPFKEGAAWIKLQGALPGAGVALAGDFASQAAMIITGRLAALFARVPSIDVTVQKLAGTDANVTIANVGG